VPVFLAMTSLATVANQHAVASRPVAPKPWPVLEVGDSLGIDLGWGLGPALAGSGHAFVNQAAGDTGLAETWYYNWPAHLATDLATYRPGLVVVFLGANDVENLYVDGHFAAFGSPAWAHDYGERVEQVLRESLRSHANVLWVGMPPMGSPAFSSDMRTLNAVYWRQASHEGKDAAYFSSWDVLGGPHGQYEAGPPGASAEGTLWRAPDGIHITTAGAQVLAGAVMRYLQAKGWLGGPKE